MSVDSKIQIKERLKDKITDWYEHQERRIYFTVPAGDICEIVNFLFKELGLRFNTASALDNSDNFEIVYFFSDDKIGQIFSIRVFIKDKKNPEIDSLAPQLKAAEWIEREIWELFGINFKGHPDLRHLLLADDWPKDEYPLRKSYKKPHEK